MTQKISADSYTNAVSSKSWNDYVVKMLHGPHILRREELIRHIEKCEKGAKDYNSKKKDGGSTSSSALLLRDLLIMDLIEEVRLLRSRVERMEKDIDATLHGVESMKI